MLKKDVDYKIDLAEKLESLKIIEGFPIGTDKDIISLSEPPYFTACPNPYVSEFIKEFGKPYIEATDTYHCEPYVGNISEGKQNPFYNAHTYHTKVPHPAIMKYIEHYTGVGDIIYDGFSGSGMAGIAAQLLKRKIILSDIAPSATFLSYNFNNQVDKNKFLQHASSLIEKLKKDCLWLYETQHNPNSSQSSISIDLGKKGIINYVVWSESFICPYCNDEFVFYHQAVNDSTGEVNKEFNCKNCTAIISKINCKRATEKYYDKFLEKEINQTKYTPVLINYSYGKKRISKTPDKSDFELLDKINSYIIPDWVPSYDYMFKGDKWGDTWRAGIHLGITNVHHFFLKRQLIVLSHLFSLIEKVDEIEIRNKLMMAFTGIVQGESKLNRFLNKKTSFPFYMLSGTLYIASKIKENNIITDYSNKLLLRIKKLVLDYNFSKTDFIVSTNSSTHSLIPDNSIDYIFTDPPFGENIFYSELNFIWESWLKVFTNNEVEAVISTNQNKDLSKYYYLMLRTFKEYYRVLKPKRWITVEFHNSKSSVWNAIQESLVKAGFIIARVCILDKKEGSFKQINAPGAVKSDLVISAFKPANSFSEKFLKQAGYNLEIDFIYQFLENLPKLPSSERTDKMLYSKMLAYYVQHGYEINYNSKSFYSLLQNNFIEQDGYWFNPEQISVYREFKQKMKLEGIKDIKQGSMLLFITDENSSLLWLYNFISEPKSFSQISTAFTQLSEIQGDNVPDLKQMLDENFVFENDKYRRPVADNEKSTITEKRERSLMRVFESILIEAKNSRKKISLVRKEALLHGFETCYKQNRFEDIITIVNRLDSTIIENSTELTDFIEIARIKVEGIK